MEKLQLWAGPRSLAVQGSSQRAGMSRSVGWMAACTAPELCSFSWSTWTTMAKGKAKVVVFLQGAARATPVWLQQCIAADPATTQPTTCCMTPSSGEALKTTPTGLPSRRYTSTGEFVGALTFSGRCTRSRGPGGRTEKAGRPLCPLR